MYYSVTGVAAPLGTLYGGDLYPGDREATEAEVAVLATVNAIEIKKRILADAMAKREVLLHHLRWFYVKAKEEPDSPAKDAKVAAISTAISSFHTVFTDPRIVSAVDGAAKLAVFIVYKEITDALKLASLSTYNAIKALDAL
jgi:hypothetical protein